MVNEYLARPVWVTNNPALDPHLKSVAETIAETTSTGPVREAAPVAGRFHDFGKLTEWFQEYVRMSKAEQNKMTAEERRKKEHSLLGAFATLYTLEQRGAASEVSVPAFLAVAKHHGRLGDVETMLDSYANQKKQKTRSNYVNIEKQTVNILTTAQDAADTIFHIVGDDSIGMEDFARYINSEQPLRTLTEYEISAETYQHVMHIWGLLTYADKLDSADLADPTPDLAPLDPEAITDHVESLPPAEPGTIPDELNGHRERARGAALNRIDAWAETDSHFATLTLPTGFGKTLTGLQTALKRATQKDSRVIYALPYTSIIDQTDAEIREVFGYAPTDPEYTIHQHLADTRSLTAEANDLDRQELLAEMWRSNITLTTFVQLFESLAGPTNRQSLKLPALENAVVLLDEPQAIPHKWWHFISRAAKLLHEEFNAEVIMMTATQPRLLRHLPYTDDPFSLLDDAESYYRFLDENPRVEYNLHPSVEGYLEDHNNKGVSVEEAAQMVAETETDSTLAICNTIASTTALSQNVQSELRDCVSLNGVLDEVYDCLPSAEAFHRETVALLRLKVRSQSNPIVATLTTRLRPIDRTVLIACIRALLDDDAAPPLYVVSTQLVEAGVDVSFDALYRDLAPISSLVQAAGRCNRSFEGTSRTVTLWRLASQNGRTPPSDLIYADTYDLLRPTRETLGDLTDDGRISEYRMVYGGTGSYYDTLHCRTRPGDKKLADAVNKGEFKTLGRERMISDEYPMVDVFIARTENERRLYAAYRTFANNGEFDRAAAIRSVLASRRISVPVTSDELHEAALTVVPELDDVFYLDAVEYGGQYDLDGGGGLRSPDIEDRFFV